MRNLLALVIAVLTVPAFAEFQTETICNKDERVPSTISEVGRATTASGSGTCTLTLIGRSCAISAGHCSSVLKIGEFNTLPSTAKGKKVRSLPEDTYEIDPASIVQDYTGLGNDWAVFKFRPNNITQKLPGDVQGFLNVRFTQPEQGAIMRISGYGTDYGEPTRHLAQQTNTGELLSANSSSSAIQYRVDTMGGNSGSSLIDENTREVFGIHTNGGCIRNVNSGGNWGVSIAKNAALTAAIKSCLDSDK
ncbi:MAG: trypsin-like serine peptidase [Bacteriovoracaceae bacterium]